MHNVIHLHNKLQMIRQQVFTFSFTCPGFVVLFFFGHIYGKMYFSKFMEASRERLAGSDGPDGHHCHNDH